MPECTMIRYAMCFLCAAILYDSCSFASVFVYANDTMEDSCMIGDNSFNRSCIFQKIMFLLSKVPIISKLSTYEAGSLSLVKLPDYAVESEERRPKSRTLFSTFSSLMSESIVFFLKSYGVKIPVPALSSDFPGIIEENDHGRQIHEDRKVGKHKTKKFAMIFPLIATVKFIIIKALLIPILMGIMAIKKMLVMAAMAIPTIIAMLRLCRAGPGVGGLLAGSAGLTGSSPLMTPYVASDTIIGDFSNYAPSAAHSMAQSQFYNSKQDFGGRNYI